MKRPSYGAVLFGLSAVLCVGVVIALVVAGLNGLATSERSKPKPTSVTRGAVPNATRWARRMLVPPGGELLGVSCPARTRADGIFMPDCTVSVASFLGAVTVYTIECDTYADGECQLLDEPNDPWWAR